jgi:hypothetical protein
MRKDGSRFNFSNIKYKYQQITPVAISISPPTMSMAIVASPIWRRFFIGREMIPAGKIIMPLIKIKCAGNLLKLNMVLIANSYESMYEYEGSPACLLSWVYSIFTCLKPKVGMIALRSFSLLSMPSISALTAALISLKSAAFFTMGIWDAHRKKE